MRLFRRTPQPASELELRLAQSAWRLVRQLEGQQAAGFFALDTETQNAVQELKDLPLRQARQMKGD